MNRGWEYRSALPSCLRFAFSRHEAEFCSHTRHYKCTCTRLPSDPSKAASLYSLGLKECE
jgi:hypothetical protein